MIPINPHQRQLRFVIKPVVFLAAASPLMWLVARAAGFAPNDLGANPIETVLETLGKTGLNTLLITLTITPLRRATGWQWLVRLRRMLGLFAFAYLSLHFVTYVVLDQGLDWPTLVEDVLDRPFITAGFAALLMMIPLAVTSTRTMQRRLGKSWRRLHMLVYPIATLGVIHFYWQTKRDVTEPVIYIAVLMLLLGLRLAHWRRRTASRRESHRDDDGSDSRATTARQEIPNPASQ